MIHEILEELNLENGSNYKTEVLKKYSNNEQLKDILKMTYDIVAYTYGVSLKQIDKFEPEAVDTPVSLDFALASLKDNFATRELTGHKALQTMANTVGAMYGKDAELVRKIINRDLRINTGKTQINKVFKGLIVKPPYTRCEIGTSENIDKNMDFTKEVFSQQKMDGTFRRAIIDSDIIDITSRPGISTPFPIIEEQITSLNLDGNVLIGEMTLRGEKDRKKGNGLINSHNVPHEDVVFTVWDLIPMNEFSMTKAQIKQAEKDNSLSLYSDRFRKLELIFAEHKLPNIELVETRRVKSMEEAYSHFFELASGGFEGTVIKAHDMTHKDGNSKKQLKVKKLVVLDMRCTGFTEGKKGTKREATFGAMTFQNDEGTIVGKCSGFSDEMLEEINNNREFYIGNVFEIACNDVTIAKNKNTYALSHGNFKKWRNKDETDTLDRALELVAMSNSL